MPQRNCVVVDMASLEEQVLQELEAINFDISIENALLKKRNSDLEKLQGH